ncbi:MAG: substrate-binding domain-containing protein [Actinomycetota bacterium]|nr:substrate-binding domain-containing protein [Actinomycetota bacterium]
MKRRIYALLLALSAVLGTGAAHADNLMPGSKFCDQSKAFKGISVLADGPASQLPVHADVFRPAFAAACRSGSGLVTYLGSGDRAGIDVVLDHYAKRTFGTSDVPFSTAEWLEAWFDLHSPDRHNRLSAFGLHQVPLYVNVISVGYNLPSCKVSSLQLRSQVLSMIYAGVINFWDHQLLVQDNPKLATCHYPIRILKRAEEAGTTVTFKNYLAKRNPYWRYYEQPEQNQVWPSVTNACPALGEDGMADCILSTQNSIGYLQYHEAKVRGVRVARLDNAAGATSVPPAFIPPSPQGCTEAASSAVLPPAKPAQEIPVGIDNGPHTTLTVRGASPTSSDWSTVSITDATVGYPLCSFSFALIFQELQHAYSDQPFDQRQARTAVDYLITAVSDRAQARLPLFGFGRLPKAIQDASREGLTEIVVV